jgi:hypothetical protein
LAAILASCLFALVAAGVTATAAGATGSAADPIPLRGGLRPGVTPLVGGNGSASPTPFATTAHLNYYGGHVVSNVQVVSVLWGSGSYLPEVNPNPTPTKNFDSFFTNVLTSPYMDWLSEYDTNRTASGGGPGTNQLIGHGTFAGRFQITPSSGANGSTIDDTQIQPELRAQILAGHLPAPTTDAAGNTNTEYMLFFPNGKTITMGGAASGVQFCAYHGTIAQSSPLPELFYATLPDNQTGGMSIGCGGGTSFQNMSSYTSHELIETVTDGEVGLATTFAPPLAWYDPNNNNGEIGDICNGNQGSFLGGDGNTYTVQKEWSNLVHACIVRPPNEFSISASPTTPSVAQGSSTQVTINTATGQGAAQAVKFTATGLPAGVTAAFNPAQVMSGTSSTLTLSASPSAALGPVSIVVVGTGTTGRHSAPLALTITSGGGGGIVNGGFETGTFSGWSKKAAAAVVTSGCHSGNDCAQLGQSTATNGSSSISQTFVVPNGNTQVSFFFRESCPDTVNHDYAMAKLIDNTTATTIPLLAKTCTTNAWTQVTHAVTAGHNVTIQFLNHDDNVAANPTFTLIDDVTTS